MAKDCFRRSTRCSSCLRCGRRPCTSWQGPRSVVRLGRTVLTYRGCLRWTLAALAATIALLITGAVAGSLMTTGLGAAALALVWAACTLRVIRMAPACPAPGGGGPGPGGAGVREPRRPRPTLPGGAIAMPLPEDPPDGAAALA